MLKPHELLLVLDDSVVYLLRILPDDLNLGRWSVELWNPGAWEQACIEIQRTADHGYFTVSPVWHMNGQSFKVCFNAVMAVIRQDLDVYCNTDTSTGGIHGIST